MKRKRPAPPLPLRQLKTNINGNRNVLVMIKNAVSANNGK